MFGSKVLEVAAGISFVFLLLSLMCSSMTEFISRMSQWRHDLLEDGIRAMLNGLSQAVPGISIAQAQSAVTTAKTDFQTASQAFEIAKLNVAAAVDTTAKNAAMSVAAAAESQFAATKIALAKARVEHDILVKHPVAAAAVNEQVNAVNSEWNALTWLSWIQKRVAKTILGKTRVRQAALANKIPALELLESPLITSLAGKNRVWLGKQDQRPSYIPSRTFSEAFFNLFAPADPNQPVTLETIRESVAHMQPSEAQRALLGMIDRSKNDLEMVRKNVEQWFDNMMEQVSAWYQRKANTVLFGIACVVCCGLNADSIAIGTALWQDEKLRMEVFKAAQAEVEKHAEQADSIATSTALGHDDHLRKAHLNAEQKATAAGNVVKEAEAAAKSGTAEEKKNMTAKAEAAKKESEEATKAVAAAKKNAETALEKLRADVARTRAEIKKSQDQLFSLGIPIGWTTKSWETFRKCDRSTLEKVVGLIVTTFAVSLGAPFWFDTLNKLVNLRSAAAKPKRSDDELKTAT